MAEEKKDTKNSPENNPSEEDIFSEPVKEQPDSEDIFSADEELSKAVQEELKAADSGSDKEIEKKFRFASTAQKIIVLVIIGIEILIAYFLLFSGSDEDTSENIQSNTKAVDKIPPAPNRESVPAEDKQLEKEKKLNFPVSLHSAEKFYKKSDYENAYVIYKKLEEKSGFSEKNQLIGDYIKLRMGLCASAVEFSEGMEEENNFVSPADTFKQLSQSQSPVVRITAYSNLSRKARNKGNYLSARSYLYKIMALSSLLKSNTKWRKDLIQKCKYASAEQLTRKIISLSERGQRIPENIWEELIFSDILADKDITEIETILQQGKELIANESLLPEIRQVDSAPEINEPVWKVNGSGICIDDFLAKVGRSCEIGIEWDTNAQLASVKNRTVSIFISAGAAREIITTAAGSAGLLAYKKNTSDDEQETYCIYNPEEYKELDQHIRILAGEAENLWQQFLLKNQKRSRTAIGHFCLGTLHAERQAPVEAIAEYQLVYNNYPYSKTAPVALMESSRIKTDFKDYQGAREDLRRLVEQFPDSPLNQLANTYLGRQSMKAGEYKRAYRSFKKVYYFSDNKEDALKSAFSAAKCRYHLGDMKSTKIWINRFLNKADKKHSDYYKGWYLAGLCCQKLGENKKADIAFKKAVSGKLPADHYIEALKHAVRFSVRNADPLQALGLIKTARKKDLPREQNVELLLVKAETMAEIGLIDKAIELLESDLKYVSDRKLKARLLFDLGKYQVKADNPAKAKTCFTRTITQTENSELIRESNLALAEICFETGETQKTIDMCTRLLDTSFKKELQNRARQLLIKSYNKQNKFDKAIELIAADEKGKQFSKNVNDTSADQPQQQENVNRN
jgi:tetratricopeptide (TPR) repeat protein